ncbi:hypothetical protein ACO0RG_003181 [Hanseniaspora osmophila]|uniref:Mitochondrial intermembrane space cysteine motif-containing protein MIX17 n=1 Tax=Hanseniaspora osmophila TaxID=56408 RepID=A0A1E5REC8_9ASCO|nr:Mitochondrial intermembrane space cysteine motif-containing protein MIX17 [Hanseniaspora osmophila]
MARSRGSARSSARPMQSSRSAHTMAAPARAAPAQTPNYSHPQTAPAASAAPMQQVQQKQPGLFAQMASTAAGVAVGSAVGHTLGAGLTGMFSGSGSSEAAPVQADAQAQPQYMAAAPAPQQTACDVDARNFTRCLEDNQGNMQACDFYLQQLKACQQAASQY